MKNILIQRLEIQDILRLTCSPNNISSLTGLFKPSYIQNTIIFAYKSLTHMAPLVVVVNSTGAQGSSVVYAASAAGFQVRAQVRSASKPEAKALEALPNVTLTEGSVEDHSFVSTLFKDADFAWVNTVWIQEGEERIGKALALAARDAGVKHYAYFSLADHSRISNGKWKQPTWVKEFAVEEFIRGLDNLPATFV